MFRMIILFVFFVFFFFLPFILKIVIFTLERVEKFAIAADGHKNLVTNLTVILGLVNRSVYFSAGIKQCVYI